MAATAARRRCRRLQPRAPQRLALRPTPCPRPLCRAFGARTLLSGALLDCGGQLCSRPHAHRRTTLCMCTGCHQNNTCCNFAMYLGINSTAATLFRRLVIAPHMGHAQYVAAVVPPLYTRICMRLCHTLQSWRAYASTAEPLISLFTRPSPQGRTSQQLTQAWRA